MELVTVDKVTVAACQIDTAIYLTFNDIEENSICTLINAAWGIVWPLLENSDNQSIRNYFAEIYNSDGRRTAWDVLNEFSTYCKHSKKDSEKLFQYPSGITQSVIAMVIDDFSRLSSVTSQYMDIYLLWFSAKHSISGAPNYNDALRTFPNLPEKTESEQKVMGLAALQQLQK